MIQAKAQEFIIGFCQDNGGIFTKVIQQMSNKSGQEHTLSNWQGQMGTVLSLKDVKKVLKAELGRDWEQYIVELYDEHYPASIGQVTKGKLTDGTEVALKIQYPHVEASIRKQLKLLGLLPTMSNMTKVKKWGVDFNAYYDMIENMLRHELDYELEAKNQQEFSKLFSGIDGIEVPNVFLERSTKKVLIQKFITGDNFKTACDSYSKSQKQAIADKLIKSFLYALFNQKKIHSDPNPYNFIFTPTQLYLIDFGQTASFSDHFISALYGLYMGLKTQSEDSVLKYFVALGFEEKKLRHIQSKLPMVAEIILRPYLAPYRFDLANWSYAEHLKLVLGENLWWFRSAGGTEFFALMKAFSNLKEMVGSLGVHVHFHQIIEDILGQKNVDFVPIADLKVQDETKFKVSAKQIHIRLIKDGVEKVKLNFPSSALLDLPDYLDEEVKNKLLEQNLKIEEIIRKAIDNGVWPGVLFEIHESHRDLKVWLE